MEKDENDCLLKRNPDIEVLQSLLQDIAMSSLSEDNKNRVLGMITDCFRDLPTELFVRQIQEWQDALQSVEISKGHKVSHVDGSIKVNKEDANGEMKSSEGNESSEEANKGQEKGFVLDFLKAAKGEAYDERSSKEITISAPQGMEEVALVSKDVSLKDRHGKLRESSVKEGEKMEDNSKRISLPNTSMGSDGSVLKPLNVCLHKSQEKAHDTSSRTNEGRKEVSSVHYEVNDCLQVAGENQVGLEGKGCSKREEAYLGPTDNIQAVNTPAPVSNKATVIELGETCSADHVKDMKHVNQVGLPKAPVTRLGEQCPTNGSPCNCTLPLVYQQKESSISSFPADAISSDEGHALFAHLLKIFPDIFKLFSKGLTSHVYQQPPKEVSHVFSGMDLQNGKLSNDNGIQKVKDIERGNKISPSSLPNALHSPCALNLPNYGQIHSNVQAPFSYAEAVSANRHSEKLAHSCLIEQVAELEEEGGSLVKVPSEILNKRLEFCKLSVIGRVILGKGEEVWHTKKLRERLNEVWGFTSSWRLISLGKGYFHLLFSSQDEFDKVWKRGVISLKPGVLRIQKFIFGVDPTKEKTTHAQVWFRLFHLPWCLWDSSILAALARKIGTPIRFDNNTINGDFGHYARILIEVDLSKSIKSDLHLDCGNTIFNIKVIPENMPQFCKACSNIGHSSLECRMLKKRGDIGHLHNNNGDCKVKPHGNEVEMDQRSDNKDTRGTQVENGISRQAVLAIENRVEIQRNQRKGRYDRSVHFTQGLDVPLLQGSKGVITSNKFDALQEDHENEVGIVNKETQNNDTLKRIRTWAEHERRKITQQGENSELMGDKEVAQSQENCNTPKQPKRWSDLIEEEEEEAGGAKSNPVAHHQQDFLCFERNGELAEIQLSTGKVRFSPVSNKKKG